MGIAIRVFRGVAGMKEEKASSWSAANLLSEVSGE
jgi:hypothetical protein